MISRVLTPVAAVFLAGCAALPGIGCERGSGTAQEAVTELLLAAQQDDADTLSAC